MNVSMFVCVYVGIHICIYLCMVVCMYVCMYVCLYMYVRHFVRMRACEHLFMETWRLKRIRGLSSRCARKHFSSPTCRLRMMLCGWLERWAPANSECFSFKGRATYDFRLRLYPRLYMRTPKMLLLLTLMSQANVRPIDSHATPRYKIRIECQALQIPR